MSTMHQHNYRLGIDVGSTTVKAVIIDCRKKDILYSCYRRHNARQMDTVCEILNEISQEHPNETFRISVCGSGGRPVADALSAHYIQEVVANAAAVKILHPQSRTAIELGGQDAKIIFFYYDDNEEQLLTSDMRMNGSCAGGTGAFIDEVASLLNVPVNEFEALASKGKTVYDISGRCGVFAKTDIQPLLIQGASKEDIALSTFHSIAKQTIGGLSQGLDLTAPIIFEGGPLHFNPTLIKVFAQRLNLHEDDILIPNQPEIIVAHGAAIAVDNLFPEIDQPDSKQAKDFMTAQDAVLRLRKHYNENLTENMPIGKPFFESEKELKAFNKRHCLNVDAPIKSDKPVDDALIGSGEIGQHGDELNVYIGIDSGSTTSKIAIMDENENLIDTFYSNNLGDPLVIVKDGLKTIYEKYMSVGTELKVLGLGTTGYGELLFAEAFGADYHTVETVAHMEACKKFVPDVSFILDIGGQDMKAIWIKDGISTNVVLNEACSSGCGSFLESFAGSLNIPVEEISEAAFRSKDPAVLGSRCTVFMNSTIISEQRNGKQADDIMAGLCRSIIENVFTKVIRISDKSELGEKIVVQGGTFRNQAVLRAIEEYLDHEVILAPYTGEIGALGAAIAAKHHIERFGYNDCEASSFIGFLSLSDFEYTKDTGIKCTLCANQCARTITTFTTGKKWITGNRCQRGGLDNVENKIANEVSDMFKIRNKLLFNDYRYTPVAEEKDEVIGLPRVLEFWDSMPFWNTFFKALGYKTKFSNPSTHNQYEQGLQFVSSDTICFPAKLVHGHISDLGMQGVDRIFMPYVMHMPPEGVDKISPYVCPVIMGYPMVVKNFEDPAGRYNTIFDTPVFHWFTEKDRQSQICDYAINTLNVSKEESDKAFKQAECALIQFRDTLTAHGKKIIHDAEKNGTYAVVLAGRPYHSDPFVNHNIPELFTKRGVPVLTVDSLPELNHVDLKYTRAEITNNFHTRMLSAAYIAASHPNLQYAQIISFGCGHDAILTEETTRIMNEISSKSPLLLKVDESDATGALNIRVQSFIETLNIKRDKLTDTGESSNTKPLSDPYTTKFHKSEKKQRTVIIPNIYAPISKILGGAFKKAGFKTKTVSVGGKEEIKLGKKYTHNDICFPCQMVIGEAINELQQGNYKKGEVAVAMIKFQCDCRMSQYSGLLRKALDSAGFSDVPILTTDFNNTKNMHPGVSPFGPTTIFDAVWGAMILDILESLRRKIRPYELNKGESNRVFNEYIEKISSSLGEGLPKAIREYRNAIDAFCKIPYDKTYEKPKVFVIGEILVNFHPGTNFDVENYLADNDMEVIFPRVTSQLRKDFLATVSQIRDFKVKQPKVNYAAVKLFDIAQSSMEKIASKHPLFEKEPRPQEIYENVRTIIPETLSCGEGWLIPGEISHYASEGVNSFVILQPFGCLPNHICGRGVTKRLKDDYPAIQILPIDLDPDTSFANVENRLQMLIMNEKSRISMHNPGQYV